MKRIRLVLAEDHHIVAGGLSALLANDETIDLIAVVHDGRALVEAADRLNPDVIVTDISMPGLNGLDAIRQVIARRPETRVVVLTMHRETQLAVDAFRAGAFGYVLKLSPVDELTQAIKEAAQGRSFVTTLIARDLISLLIDAGRAGSANESPLTMRQREVLQLIAEGKTMKEIGALLNISARTAESHRAEIVQALGLKTTAELVQYAIRTKLIEG